MELLIFVPNEQPQYYFEPVMFHWTEGGTCLTNFSREQLPLYKQAIEELDSSLYVVSEQSMGGWSDSCSLHKLDIQINRNASPFWEVFDSIRDRQKSTLEFYQSEH